MLNFLKEKLISFIDAFFLPDAEKLRTKLEKKKKETGKLIVSNLTSKIDGLENIILDTYQEVGFVSIYFKDYKNFISDLKGNKPINPLYQEDIIKKDIMLNLYKVMDSKSQKWFLVVDMTNSPNIGLRDYWKVAPAGASVTLVTNNE